VLLVAVLVVLRQGMLRAGRSRLGPADRITVVRAVLTCVVAALATHPTGDRVAVGLLTAVTTVALVLDGVDGRVARATGTASRFGARFDMEVDALLVLVLSVHAARSLGPWVLLIGAARYLLLAATRIWPWLDRDLPPRRWARVVAVVQGVVLTAVGSGLLPVGVSAAAVVVAMGLLAESFGHQVVQLRRLHLEPHTLPDLVLHG
jgi:phosphatidylglycerophosphate synthase